MIVLSSERFNPSFVTGRVLIQHNILQYRNITCCTIATYHAAISRSRAEKNAHIFVFGQPIAFSCKQSCLILIIVIY